MNFSALRVKFLMKMHAGASFLCAGGQGSWLIFPILFLYLYELYSLIISVKHL